MPYSITYEPLNRIRGVKPKTVTCETAAETLRLVNGLQMSDEKVVIRNPQGSEIGYEELKFLAEQEQA